MSKRFVIVGIIVLALLGGLAYFQLVFKPQLIRQFIANMPRPPITVSAQKAHTQDWVPRIHAIGSLVAYQGVEVASQVGGVASKVSIDSGQDVAGGAQLVQLDGSVEQADLKSNIAKLKQANLELARQRDLEKKGVASQAKLESAQATRDAAAAAVERTQALIAQKTITAPFAGRLGIRKVDLGQYVSPGLALVSLQELDPIRADFTVPENEIRRLKVGQVIEITVDSYPGKVFRGQIEAFDAQVSQETRTLLVRARLANPDKKLLPGMFANIVVLVGVPEATVTVPRTAVTYSLYGDTVYVLKPETKSQAKPAGDKANKGAAPAETRYVAERRVVTLGDISGDQIAILKGITAGEMVVTSGQLKLQPGAQVRVDNATAPKAPAVRPKD